MSLSKDDIQIALIQLAKVGLIEVTGISEDGEEVWGATELSSTLSDDEIDMLIAKSFSE